MSVFDHDQEQRIVELAARVSAEMARNLGRGTGGATLPLPVTKLATVTDAASVGETAQIKADGDDDSVPATNASGVAIEDGDRVLVDWLPPSGVYVRSLLSRSARGTWTPTLSGPSSNGVNSVGVGHYTRIAHRVNAYGMWTFGSGGSYGTAPVIGGLPFPLISDGDSILGAFKVIAHDVSAARYYPVEWLVAEGASDGQVWFHNAFGGAAVLLSTVSDTAPFSVVGGDRLYLQAVYDTDAA